jgi:ribonuclease Z
MELYVIGAGEAFDPEKNNASYIIKTGGSVLLIDCGITTPHALWRKGFGNNISHIYITHFHSDHMFGLPALITRMFEEKRKVILAVIGQKGIEKQFYDILDLGYKGIREKLEFKIEFIESEDNISLHDFSMEFALTQHSSKNIAVCINSNGKTLCISGDGAPTEKLIALYKKSKADLIIQETFTVKKATGIHCSLEEINTMRTEHGINSAIGITHVSRGEIAEMLNQKLKKNTFFLNDGQTIQI